MICSYVLTHDNSFVEQPFFVHSVQRAQASDRVEAAAIDSVLEGCSLWIGPVNEVHPHALSIIEGIRCKSGVGENPGFNGFGWIRPTQPEVLKT